MPVPKDSVEAQMRCAAVVGDLPLMQRLLTDFDHDKDAEMALSIAVECNQLDAVKLLAPLTDQAANGFMAIRMAALRGRPDILRVLLSAANPSVLDAGPLHLAARAGHANVMDQLVPLTPRTADDGEAICVAANNGHLAAVKALLPTADLESKAAKIMLQAASDGYADIIQALLETKHPAVTDAMPAAFAHADARDRHHVMLVLAEHADRPRVLLRASASSFAIDLINAHSDARALTAAGQAAPPAPVEASAPPTSTAPAPKL